jgi:predicted nucleic acid-binding protein
MLLIDTSVLVAAANRADRHHGRCADLLSNAAGPLLMPVLAVTEAGYLMDRALGPSGELALARSIEAGELVAEPVHEADWGRIATLVETYLDMPLGVVDASIVAVAERLGLHELATLDRRHFSTVRPNHSDGLTLLP